MGQDLYIAVACNATARLAVSKAYVVAPVNIQFASHQVLNVCCARHPIHQRTCGLGVVLEWGNIELGDWERDMDRETKIKAEGAAGKSNWQQKSRGY
jgi:hypothetical protein